MGIILIIMYCNRNLTYVLWIFVLTINLVMWQHCELVMKSLSAVFKTSQTILEANTVPKTVLKIVRDLSWTPPRAPPTASSSPSAEDGMEIVLPAKTFYLSSFSHLGRRGELCNGLIPFDLFLQTANTIVFATECLPNIDLFSLFLWHE